MSSEEETNINPSQPTELLQQQNSSSFLNTTNSTSFLKKILFILLVFSSAIGLTYAGFLYGRSTAQKEGSKFVRKELSPTPTPLPPTSTPTTLATPTPTKEKPAPTIKLIQIPPNWKTFTDTDPLTKLTVSLTLPPGYKFRFTGSEWTIGKDGEEIWDYNSSIMLGENATPVNKYDGSSRRRWYQRYLNEEFLEEEPFLTNKHKIISVKEHPIGATTYLEIEVENSLSKRVETHFVYVQNGILHIIKPVSEKAFSKDSEIYKNIDKILYSLKSQFSP